MARTKTKTKTKTRRPLTISIHGQSLDIEAKIGDSRLADVLAEAIARTTGRAPTSTSESPLATLIGEFGRSLRTDQLELLMKSFDMTQKVLFMEIMNTAGYTQSDQPQASRGASTSTAV